MAWWKQKPTIPQNAGHLAAWLRDTIEGRKILRDATEEFLEERCLNCAAVYRRPKVLVVVRRLGSRPGVEVFAERGVSVRIEEMVDTCDDPAMERLAEELLVALLPNAWKSLPGCPGYMRQSQVFTGLTAERLIERLEALDWLALIRDARSGKKLTERKQ